MQTIEGLLLTTKSVFFTFFSISVRKNDFISTNKNKKKTMNDIIIPKKVEFEI